MKSAYELAMERLQAEQGNGPALTDAQRDEIAKLVFMGLSLRRKQKRALSFGHLHDFRNQTLGVQILIASRRCCD